jgi:hypothetical protein
MTHSVLQDVSGDVRTTRDERRHEAQSTFDRPLREYFWITSDCRSSQENRLETPQLLHLTDAKAVSRSRLVDYGCLNARRLAMRAYHG